MKRISSSHLYMVSSSHSCRINTSSGFTSNRPISSNHSHSLTSTSNHHRKLSGSNNNHQRRLSSSSNNSSSNITRSSSINTAIPATAGTC